MKSELLSINRSSSSYTESVRNLSYKEKNNVIHLNKSSTSVRLFLKKQTSGSATSVVIDYTYPVFYPFTFEKKKQKNCPNVPSLGHETSH